MPDVEQQSEDSPKSFLVHRREVTSGLEELGAGLGWVVVREFEGGTLDRIRARGAPVLPWNHGPIRFNGRTLPALGAPLDVSALAHTSAGEQLWLLRLAYPVSLAEPPWLVRVVGSLRQDLLLVLADRDALLGMFAPDLAGMAILFAPEGAIAAVYDWRSLTEAREIRLMVDGVVPGSPVVHPLVVRVTGPEHPWESSGHLVRDPDRSGRWVRLSGTASEIETFLESPFVLAVQPFEAAEASGCGCGCQCGCGGIVGAATVTPRVGSVEATGIGDVVTRALLPTNDATVIAFADSGCDTRHPDLEGRVIAEALKPALDVQEAVGGDLARFKADASDTGAEKPYGHGTHVVGIAIGDGKLKGNATEHLVGPAPRAIARMLSVVSSVEKPLPAVPGFRFSGASGAAFFGIPIDLTGLFEELRNGPPSAYVLSCSWNFPATSYGYASNTTDAWCHEKADVLLIFSAGNGASDVGVTEPATAKNVLTVGAVNAIGKAIERSSAPGVGRVKPDVRANGDLVASTAARYDESGEPYVRKTGTSMAAPFVAGLAARIREQLIAESGRVPSAALLKAILVHLGARSGPVRSVAKVDPTTDLTVDLVRFEEPALKSGDIWRIVVTPGLHGRATLVWTDPPTADGSLYNELLLRVAGTGIEGDKGDNVQSIEVSSTSNVVAIEVVGATVRSAGQAFALVLSGLTPVSAPERVLAANYTVSTAPLPNPAPNLAAPTASALVQHLALPASVEVVDERRALRQRRFELSVEPGAEELWMYLDGSAADLPKIRLSAVTAGKRVQVPMSVVEGRVAFRVPTPTARTTLRLDMPGVDPVDVTTAVRRQAPLLDVWRDVDGIRMSHTFHPRAPLESVQAWVREDGVERGPFPARLVEGGFVDVGWPLTSAVRLLCTWMEPETGVRYRRYSRWIGS